jgi:type II restriction/modification system DNA methylase subunit YeeA
MPFFHSFENNRGIFQDVHRSYKFALMQVVNNKPGRVEDQVIDTAFYVLDPTELDRKERHVQYPLETLKALSPDQWALMELRDAADLPILRKCYSSFKPLSRDWLQFRNELHMTGDKRLFIEDRAVGLIPLYQGKMIWQYDHMFESAEYWLDPNAFDGRLRSKELYRMAQDLNVSKASVAKYESGIRYDREYVRLGFREIARDTDERTLIFSLIPENVGVGHKINISVPKTYYVDTDGQVNVRVVSPIRLLFALACFNSIVVDWLARFMVQISVSQTYLYRLPMPQPSDDEILGNVDYALLAKNALLLSLAANWDDFSQLAREFNIQKTDLPKSTKAMDILRAENDKLVAKMYGISEIELAHLLQSFRVMSSKRPEYLTLLQ